MGRVLYVGFKGEHNSSFQLVNQFPGEKYFLTNSYNGLRRDIDALDEHYDSIYMFGLDKNLHDSVRIERYAEQDGHYIETRFNIFELISQFNNLGISFTVSNHPTHYLCNSAYYHMLNKMNCSVVFIHIPPQRFISDSLRGHLQAFASIKCEDPSTRSARSG